MAFMEHTFVSMRKGNTVHLNQCSMLAEYVPIYIKLKNIPINILGCSWI